MPEDIFYDEQLQTAWDDVGDIKTVRGEDYVQQTVVTALIETVGLDAAPLSSTAIEQQRGNIETVVKNHHATQPPISVSVSDVDADNNTITYSIQTAQASFPLTVS